MSTVNLQRYTTKINRTYKNGKPQEDIVLEYLREHGSMDEYEADKLNINRNSLGTTISALKDMGYNIEPAHYKRKKSTFSHKSGTVRKYVLEEG